jgi:DNA modification methylase
MTEVLDNIYLNWTEKELPQKERTKHVHGLHPYLGKFVPQIPEIFLKLYFKEGDTILDPFMGSGTTLIEANILNMNSIGIDISKFNCLMVKVKTDKYNIERLKHETSDALSKLEVFVNKLLRKEDKVIQKTIFDKKIDFSNIPLETENEYINTWYIERSIKKLLAYKYIIENNDYEYKDVLKIILSRSARSARLIKHNELDWPKEPVREPYYCGKHKRTCYPTPEAFKFIKRYSRDTYKRIKEFSEIRKDKLIDILHTDSRTADIGKEIDGIFTSPPYCGLIDYHLQHEYAYHFLGLEMKKEKEIGPMEKGTSLRAQEEYKRGIIEVFRNCNNYLKEEGKVIIVVNDKENLYPEIIEKSGLIEENRVTREVNRRTGRRATEFTEDIIICRKA